MNSLKLKECETTRTVSEIADCKAVPFDVSFIEGPTARDVRQALKLLLEKHVNEGLATITARGAVVYQPSAVVAYSLYYRLSELLKGMEQ